MQSLMIVLRIMINDYINDKSDYHNISNKITKKDIPSTQDHDTTCIMIITMMIIILIIVMIMIIQPKR